MNVEVRRMETAAEKAATAQYEERAGSLPGADWVRALRDDAIGRFTEDGMPHRRIEDWKYTDLRTAIRALPAPAKVGEPVEKAPDTLSDVDAHRVVIVDGGVARLPGSIPGVEIETLESALAGGHAGFRDLVGDWPDGSASAILDLNTAFMRAGVVIRVAPGTRLDKPIHVAFVTAAPEEAAVYARNVVVLGDEAEATVIESFEGPAGVAYQVNAATRFKVGDRSKLTYVKVQRDGDQAVHLATIGGDVGADANLVFAPYAAGAALSRNNVAILLDGADTVANVAAVHLLGGRQHGDLTMFVDHKEPACVSRELMKTVLDDRARGVFQGKILVRQKAQETDGKMMSQALMLSDGAEMDNKPELEIYADNVQCGHGATNGKPDEDLLFYLRARGIPEEQAQALLIEAFIGEAVEVIGDEAIGEALSAYTHAWVAARKDTGE